MNETQQLRDLLKEAMQHIKSLNAVVSYLGTKQESIAATNFCDRALPYATLQVTPINDTH